MSTDIQFEPVYIAPYIQTVMWLRPDKDNTSPHMYVSGDRQINALDYMVVTMENADVIEHSLYNVIKDGASLMPDFELDWITSKEYESEHLENKLSGNLIKKLNE